MALRSTKETAERLNSAPGTLENWRVQGRGPAFVRFAEKFVTATKI